MTEKPAINVSELKQAMVCELERRRRGEGEFAYADEPGGPVALYGLTGAVNILAALGLPLGDHAARARIVRRIMGWQRDDGSFDSRLGPGHAAHMVIGALNLLGEPIPDRFGPLAPTDPAELSVWLERHDWQSTHKELCGPTVPLVAGGRVGAGWIEVFVRGVSGRLSSDDPLNTWCAADAPPWRVISCVFHVLSIFDAGRIAYPQPELIIRRLLDLRWEEASDDEMRTFCTDADWAWLLLRLCEHLPRHAEPVMRAIRRVSCRRVRAWNENRSAILGASTHHLYCYLWSSAVFQSCVREHYTGGYLRDTFNDPAVFRL